MADGFHFGRDRSQPKLECVQIHIARTIVLLDVLGESDAPMHKQDHLVDDVGIFLRSMPLQLHIELQAAE